MSFSQFSSAAARSLLSGFKRDYAACGLPETVSDSAAKLKGQPDQSPFISIFTTLTSIIFRTPKIVLGTESPHKLTPIQETAAVIRGYSQ